jgi:hypothetical protein
MPREAAVVVDCGGGPAEGWSNTAIAGRLGLTEKAVTRHIWCIDGELLLAPCRQDRRRVLAVVRYLTR